MGFKRNNDSEFRIKGPLATSLEVIGQCNMNCKYCYSIPRTNYVPSIPQFAYLVRKVLSSFDPFQILLSGGEPFLREDFLDLLEEVSNILRREYCKNSDLNVSTNASSLNDSSKIQRLGPIQKQFDIGLQVAIDSHIKDVQNRVRGKWTETMHAIEMLLKYGVRISIGIVISRINYKHIIKSIDYFSKWGIKHFHLMGLILSKPVLDNFEELIISEKEFIPFKKKLLSFTKDRLDLDIGHPFAGISENSLTSSGQMLQKEGCLAVLTRITITPDGEVLPCDATRLIKLGNLYRQDWSTVWASPKTEYYKKNSDFACIKNAKLCLGIS